MSDPGAYVVEIEGLARVRVRVVVREARDAEQAQAEAAAFAARDGAIWRQAKVGGAVPATGQRVIGAWPAGGAEIARAFPTGTEL